MNRYLVIAAACSILLSGCGKEEEAPRTQPDRPAVAQAPATAPAAPTAPVVKQEVRGEVEALVDSAAEQVSAAAPTSGNRGKEVYDTACFVCHAMGIAGAPKLDDKAAWAPRIAQGMEILVSHAINGFQGNSGVMPPKGGRTDLSDDDVAQAVAYMVEQAQ